MKTQILELLRETEGYISGQELCNKFGVSRTAIWKAINSLKKAGYEIEAVQNKGYKLLSVPDILSKEEIASLIESQWIGREVVYLDTVDSTNTKAKELADNGYPSGTVVISEQQTAGKGRRGRSWESPRGSNIYMTLLLKPEINPNNASMITLITAMAAARGIEEVTEMKTQIKWPNDLVVNGKKITGILTEMSAQFDYIDHIVVGIGINVHNEDFPEEIRETATSLLLESGKHYHRAQIIAKVLEYFEHYYEIFIKTEDLSALVNEYNSMLVNMHKQVKVIDPKEPFEGKAEGITPRGELIVDTWESRKMVSSGEVSVRGVYGYV